ncbi:unnamed protein product, partial [Mesorhabditis belari]|uniref:Uncharacterized protein n=1 Tax=Mesorhabditis belari TaxID=2138241 RepID=A0AAF3FH24_9BILA
MYNYKNSLQFTLFIAILINKLDSQINLGTFNLGRDPFGQWNLGFNQGANLFGFGGDRGFSLSGGDRGLGLQTNGGALVGGERVGVDSGLGLDKQNGLGLGSLLSFGNTPANRPGGQLQQFLENIGRFFTAGAAPPPTAGISSSGGPLGSIGVIGNRHAPEIPEQREIDGTGKGSGKNGEGIEVEDRVDDGEVKKGENGRFPTLEPDDRITATPAVQVESNIDEIEEFTEIPVFGKTENPRHLPGLIEMDPRGSGIKPGFEKSSKN